MKPSAQLPLTQVHKHTHPIAHMHTPNRTHAHTRTRPNVHTHTPNPIQTYTHSHINTRHCARSMNCDSFETKQMV